MTSVTIHNLEPELDRRIRRKATAKGISLNQTVKNLLRKSLGIAKTTARNNDFNEFFGIWSKSKARKIEKALEDFERIDPEDWK